jgi:hypothetical protein
MKKIAHRGILLAALLGLAGLFAGCGGGGEDYKAFDTIKLLQSGAYYYEGQYYDGSDLDGYILKMASKGNDFDFAFYDEDGNELGRSMGLSGKGYFLDAANKEYSADTYYDNVSYAYSGLTFVESGQAKVSLLAGVNDEEMYYEEYEYDVDSDQAVIRFYFSDDKLYCFQEDFVDAEGTVVSEVIVISDISDQLPEDWFAIPDEYTEVE